MSDMRLFCRWWQYETRSLGVRSARELTGKAKLAFAPEEQNVHSIEP